ncbi:MAG TPA: ATP cone domain-containing protein [Gaiellales bacterium]|jgi:2-phosphoglycerate kinase
MPRLPRIHLPSRLVRRPADVETPVAAVPGREPRILATRGAPMPFSKGRMAQALVLAGADPERAYQLAMRIEREVNATAADEIPIDHLHGMVEEILAREEGPELVSRYHGWREVLRLDRPLMLLIGGATGTGKSTLATEIAYRLGISRITSTDVIRQAMRAFFAPELMPELHYSSFDAADGLKIPLPDPDDEDRALYGFIQQAGQVAVGANAVVERAVLEGLSTVVEGVHVVPGLVTAEQHAGAVVVQLMLAITDEDVHQAHFFGRSADSGGLRAYDRYLRRFGEIRRIQEYLVGRAEKQGWPVIEAADPDRSLLAVMDLILERATARAAAIP